MNSIPQATFASGLTQESFDDFVARLKHHCRGDGVQQHCTAEALFIVQAKRIIFGIDRDYTDKLLVHVDGSTWYSPKEYWDDLDAGGKRLLNKAAKNEHGATFLKLKEYLQWEILADYENHAVTGWDETWVYVSAHFTKEAADAFIARKKHDYRLGMRVYVDAQIYCWEFNAITDALIDGRIVFAGGGA